MADGGHGLTGLRPRCECVVVLVVLAPGGRCRSSTRRGPTRPPHRGRRQDTAAARGLLTAEDGRPRRGDPAAGGVDAGQGGVGHLAVAAFAAQLLDRLDEEEDPAHAGLARRQAPAVGVGGELAAHPQPAALDEGAPLALLAEAEALQGEQHRQGERVVDLDHVDLVGGDPGLGEGLVSRPHAGGLGEVGPLAHRGVGDGLTGAEHPDRGVGAVPGPFLVGEDDGAAAVGADAAVELGEGVGDHLRGLDVLDGDGVAVVGVGIEARRCSGPRRRSRPAVRWWSRIRAMCRRADMACLAIRVWPKGASNWIGPLVPEEEVGRALAPLQVGPRRRPVAEDDGVDLTLGDGGHGVLEEDLPARAAHAGGVDVVDVGGQSQVLGQLDGGQRPRPVGHETVHLAAVDPGVGQRPGGGLVVQFERRLVVHPADIGQRGADDRHLSCHLTVPLLLVAASRGSPPTRT